MFLFLSRAEMMKLYSRGVLSFPLTSRFVNLSLLGKVRCSLRRGERRACGRLLSATWASAWPIMLYKSINSFTGKGSCQLEATGLDELFGRAVYLPADYTHIFFNILYIWQNSCTCSLKHSVHTILGFFFLLINQILKFLILHIITSD